MIWFICAAVIAVVAGIAHYVYHRDSYWADVWSSVGVGFFTLVFGACAAFILCAVFSLFTGHTEHVGWCNLKAIGDSSTTSGSFFLGSGYVDNTQVFNYYCVDDNNSNMYYRQYQDADQSVIIEDNGTPRLDQYQDIPSKWWSVAFMRGSMRNEFHVPAGTVKDGFKLDNQN